MRNLVPRLIVDNYKQKNFAGHFQAASLFVDTSGFTAITETLMQHGKEGAEILAEALRAIFAPFIEHVYAQGGFVANFSGDGFTALFPGQPPQTHHRALAAAWQIRQHMAANPGHATRHGTFTFTVTASLADGRVEWGILPDPQSDDSAAQHVYYFCGQAIDRAIQAEQQMAGGQVGLSQPVYQSLRNHVAAQPQTDHYQVTAIQGNLPPPVEVTAAPPPAGQEAFFSPTLHRLAAQGEFRQVLTMFINLQAAAQANPLPRFMEVCLPLLNQYGGHLGRIGRIGGQDAGYTLLLFWGAPTGHENDVARALDFALDLHRQAKKASFRAGLTYQLVYAGFVGSPLREEYTCYGSGVNLAARQMTAANWDDIWLDEATASSGQLEFETEAVGRFSFKGFARKQPVYRLQGRRPQTVPATFRTALVGRTQELDRLTEFIRPIFEGRFAGVMNIYGEAGIGKSRLLYEFNQQCRAAPNGSAPAWLHCPADEVQRRPLNPFRYFLRAYFNPTTGGKTAARRKKEFTQKLQALARRTGDPALQAELTRTRSILGALIDLHWPNSLYRQLPPKLRYENTLHALKTLFLAQSRVQPVILQIEDAHALDEDSRRFLGQLTRNVGSYPIAVLVAGRTPLPPDLLEQTTPRQALQLESLTGPEIRHLAEAHLAGPVAPLLVQVLAHRTDGNPFFIEQLLRYLNEQGLLVKQKSGLTPTETNGRIPTDVRAVLTARLDRLAPEVREAVQTAAVLGREFEIPVLALMLLNGGQIEPRVRAAAREAIWSALTDTRYLFNHALMRDAAYDMQLRARLRHLHRQAAEAIEQIHANNLEPHYPDLAYHYQQAEMVDQERRYARLAGEQAAAQYANTQAVEFLTRALELTPETAPAQQYAVLLARQSVYHLLGNRPAQQQDLTALEKTAARLGDVAKQAEAALKQAEYAEAVGDYSTVIATAEQVIQQIKGERMPHLEAPARLLWGRALLVLREYEPARQQLTQALNLARAAGLRQVEGDTLNSLGAINHYKSELDSAKEYYNRALQIYREIDFLQGVSRILNNFGILHVNQSDYENAKACYEQSLQVERQIGNRNGQGTTLGNLGNVFRYQGDYEEATRCYQQSLQICRSNGDRWGEAMALDNLGLIATHRGNYEQAEIYHEKALQQYRQIGDRESESMSLSYLGKICMLRGDYLAAISCFQQYLAIAREVGSPRQEGKALFKLGQAYLRREDYDQAALYFEQVLNLRQELGDRHGAGLALGSLGAARHGQRDYAAALSIYQEALALYRQFGDRGNEGAVLGYLGQLHRELGDYESAQTYLQQALEICQQTGQRHYQAEMRLQLSLLFYQLADYETAHQHGRQALDVAQVLGLDDLLAHARMITGRALAGLGHVAGAAEAQQQALAHWQESDNPKRSLEALANLAHLRLVQGNLAEAHRLVEQIMNSENLPARLETAEAAAHIYWVCHQVFKAVGDPQASTVLDTAYRLVQNRLETIDDPALRRTFQEKVAAHRQIIREWNIASQ